MSEILSQSQPKQQNCAPSASIHSSTESTEAGELRFIGAFSPVITQEMEYRVSQKNESHLQLLYIIVYIYMCVCVNMAWLFYHVDSTFLSFRFFLEGAEVAGIN